MSTVITFKVNAGAKTILVEHIKAGPDGQGAESRPLKVSAQARAKYQFVEEATGFAPENIATKRSGKDLLVAFEGGDIDKPDLIIEDYYETREGALIGQAENGNWYDYVPESGKTSDMVALLDDAMEAGQALGGDALSSGAYLPAAAPGGMPGWVWGLPALGLLGAGGGGGGGGGSKTPAAPAPAPAPPPAPPPVDSTPPAAPGAIATIDGGVRVSPPADPDTRSVVITYTRTDGSAGTATLTKDASGTWTSSDPAQAPVNATMGVVILAEALLKDGSSVVAHATDTTGNVGANASAIAGDVTPPPVTAALDPSSDSGTLGDGITNDSTPTITGTGTPGDKITVTTPTREVIVTTVSTGGTWAVTPANPLPEGANTVKVEAADPAGNTSTVNVQVAIDSVAPTAIIALGDTALKIGETAVVTITFSEAVTGLTESDFTAENGSLTGLTTSNGGLTWTALFTPNADIEDATNVVTLAAGSYSDPNGNPGASATSGNYAIDTRAPTVTAVLDPSSDSGTPGDGITGDTRPTITGTGTPGDTITVSMPTGEVLITTVTPGGTWSVTPSNALPAGANTINVEAADPAGNTTTTHVSVTIDSSLPSASIAVSDTALTAGETATVTIIFSEAVIGLTLADFTAENGTLSGLTTNDGGLTWTASFTPSANIEDATNVITLAGNSYTDLDGHNGSAASSGNYAIDTQGPSATIALSDTALKIGETSTVTITFTEAVAGLTVGDFTAENGTLSGLTTNDGGLTWTALFTPNTNIEDATNVITLAGNSYADLGGNYGGVAISGNYAIDTQAPTLTAVLDPASDSGTLGDSITGDTTPVLSGTGTPGDTITVTLPTGEVLVTTVAPGGSWTVTPVSPLPAGVNTITVEAEDPAGNTAAVNVPVTIDPSIPSATLAMSDTALTAGETATVTITFTEAVTGLSVGDFTAENGTLSGLTTNDGGLTWTATFTPNGNTEAANNVITLAANSYTDLDGHSGSAATSANYAIDTQAPSAVISVSDAALKVGEAATVTITFSEAVTGLTASDFATDNGTLSGLTTLDGGITWTATFTPDANIEDSTNVISLAGNSYSDLNGNNGSAATSGNYAIDTLAPTLTAALDASSDSGTPGDSITNDSTPTLAGTGTPGDIITVTTPTGEVLVTTVASGGSWTVTLANPLPAGTNTIGVEATDPAGNTTTVNVPVMIDASAPTATIALSDSALRIGETAAVTITFSEAVSGLAVGDFTAENGTLSGLATSDGGITWTATFTPSADITDATNIISLAANSYTDLNGNNGAAATSANYAIDTQAPTATIALSDAALKAGETSMVTITFSEAVTGLTAGDFTTENGTLSGLATSDGGLTWTATFTPDVNIEDATNVIALVAQSYTDFNGNNGAAASSGNYAIDTQGPSATITLGDAALKVGETATVTITFGEAVSGLTTSDFNAENGTLSGLASSDGGLTWTATFTPSADITDATNIISLAANSYTDLNGNNGAAATSANYAIDTQAPTATIALSDAALKVGETSTVTITFSEAVTGLAVGDFIADNGTLSGLATSDGGLTWTATFTPTADITDATNVISLAANSYTDLNGNDGASASSGNYTIETRAPTAIIALSDAALKAGETSTVTITFSEAVTGLAVGDFTAENGTLSGLSTSDGGITWTATFTPDANVTDATNMISLVANSYTDLNGNSGAGAASGNYTIDTQAPTASITLSDSALKVGETSTVTITFSEAVTGLAVGDFIAENGTLSGLATSDGGITWTATFTPTADITDATNVISLAANSYTDLNGNNGASSTSANYAIDTQAPTATIALSDANLKAGETSTVTITFSEAVSGLAVGDFTAENGTLSGLATSDGGITWTATFTPTADITDAANLISLAASSYTDLNGNNGGAAVSANYAIDTQSPTATIALSDAALAAGETATVTITFSEAVTGLTVSDFTAENGTLSGLATSDGGITWTATFTPTADITDATNTISLAANSYTDLNGNNGGAAVSANYVIDTQSPTATIALSDAALAAGETATVTITFSEAVTGLTASDFNAENGTLSGLATSDGGITWTATFTPDANVTDATNMISLVANSYSDLSGNSGAAASSGNYSIGTQALTAAITLSDNALKVGETSTVTITFSDAVTGLTESDFTAENGTLSGLATSDGGHTWTATFTPSANITDATNIISLAANSYTDLNGNNGAPATSANYAIDTQTPTAAIALSDAALKVGETSMVTITFSEAVTGLAVADFTAENGTLSDLATSDGGLTWTATFTPTANITDTTNVISLTANSYTDLNGNNGAGATSSNYAIDTQSPTATIALSDTALTAGETATVTITFSEAVTGLAVGDLTAENGTLSGLSTADGGLTWTATFTPTANITDATNIISLAANSYTDLNGNNGVAATSSNYTVDTQAPAATIALSDAALMSGETSTVTITFSEVVMGLAVGDFTAENGTLSGLATSDGGITWTATFTPTANITDTTNVISLTAGSYTDLNGNNGAAATSGNYAIDTQAPTAAIALSDNALKIGETATVTITFSEAVTGLAVADFTAENGTLSDLATSDGGLTWTATFTPTANITDAANVISLAAGSYADLNGNIGAAATSGNYAIDTQAPTATIALSDTALKVGETSTVMITFSEAVTGLAVGDFTAENGTLSGSSTADGGLTWTATFTPTANITDATNIISLAANSYTDLNGNNGAGATSSNYAIDTQAPTATIALNDANLKVGETSTVTITFSEAVTGLAVGDFTAENGTLSGLATTDGGITWTATFTPTADITDTTNVISLTAGSYTDLNGNDGAAATSGNYAVDTQAPTATIALNDANLKVGETSTVTITFSEAVTNLTVGDFTAENGTLSGLATTDGGITWTATFTPTANITDATNLISLAANSYTDLNGNNGAAVTSSNYAIDTRAPTATIALSDTALKAGDTSAVTITFSEAVTGLTVGDFISENGTLSSLTSADGGITWTATFTPSANVTDASNMISLAANSYADLNGNSGAAVNSANYTVDTQAPTATIALSDAALKIGETATVTITFSEAVAGLTESDFTAQNGTLSSLSSTDGGITWNATFTPSANITDMTNVISLAANSYTDMNGNNGAAVTSANYTVDTQAPTATIALSDTALKIGETSTVTITFSEAVTNLTVGDFTAENGTLSGLATTDGGITWTATFTPTANITDTTNVISLTAGSYTDLNGNSGAAATSGNYAVDTQAPTATIALSDAALKIGETSTVTITFSEAVTGVTNSDFVAENGTLSGLATNDGGITWTATFTPTANITDTTSLISLTAGSYTDLNGNSGAAATSGNYTIDTQAPTAAIALSDNALKIGETATVTITFSEAVTGLAVADFTAENGTLSGLSTADGLIWTATFTPTVNITDATNIISLAANSYTDLNGNSGAAATSGNYAIDTQAPTATIALSDAALKIGETSTVTITYSEAVTGLAVGDFTAENGTLSSLATTDGGITWTATFTPTANITDTSNTISLGANSYADLNGNNGAAATSGNYTIDTQAPTATIALSDTALKIGETSTVTITFSEAVTGLAVGDFTAENGTLSSLATTDGGITWTATFTPTANITDTTNILSLAANSYTDLNGNNGAAATSGNYTIDTQAPTATIALSDTALKIGETSRVTITFSEAVTGLAVGDFTAENGTLSGLATTDGGLTWTATFTPTANITDTTNILSLIANSYTDLNGNNGAAATSGNYTIDTRAPTATIALSDTALKIGETSTVTITVGEAVTGLAVGDFTVENGTLSGLATSDGGITWTATFTPTANITDTTNILSLAANSYADLNGNNGAGATSSNYAIDTQAPTATIALSDTALTAGEKATVTITFSEAVTGLTVSDFTTENGTLSGLTTSDGGVTWVATFTPTANIVDSTNSITLAANSYTDLSGNNGAAAASVNYTISNELRAVDDAGTATEDGPHLSDTVLGNDVPALGTVISVRTGNIENAGAAGSPGTALAGQYGTLTLNSNGSYTYTVNNANAAVNALSSGQSLIEYFNYTMGIGVQSDTAVLAITIQGANDAPSGTDKTLALTEDVPYAFTAADFGFTDVDGQTLTGIVVNTLPSNGTLFVDTDGNGVVDSGEAVLAGATVTVANLSKLKFAPASGWNGSTTLAFQVQDSGTNNNLDLTPNTLTLNVASVNDAPAGANRSLTGTEDTSLSIGIADFGFTDAGDSPANALKAIRFDSLPTSGTLYFDANGNGIREGSETTAASGVFYTTAQLASLKFDPGAHWSGTTQLSFTVQDNGGTANGGVDTDPTPNTLTIGINPVAEVLAISKTNNLLTDNRVVPTGETGLVEVAFNMTRDSWTNPSGTQDFANGAAAAAAIDRMITSYLSEAVQYDYVTQVNGEYFRTAAQTLNSWNYQAGGVANTTVNTASAANRGVQSDQGQLVSGWVYLQAGQQIVFRGYTDDQVLIELGGRDMVWGNSYQAVGDFNSALTGGTTYGGNGVFTVTQTGYYSLKLYNYNAASATAAGAFDVAMSVDGGTSFKRIDTTNFDLYRSITDVPTSRQFTNQLNTSLANQAAGSANADAGEGFYAIQLDVGFQGQPIALDKIVLAGNPDTSTGTTAGGLETTVLRLTVPTGLAAGSVLSDGVQSLTLAPGQTYDIPSNWNLSSLRLTTNSAPGSYALVFSQVQTDTAVVNGSTVVDTKSSQVTVDVVVQAAEAKDVMVGGGGNDTLNGGGANDILIGDGGYIRNASFEYWSGAAANVATGGWQFSGTSNLPGVTYSNFGTDTAYLGTWRDGASGVSSQEQLDVDATAPREAALGRFFSDPGTYSGAGGVTFEPILVKAGEAVSLSFYLTDYGVGGNTSEPWNVVWNSVVVATVSSTGVVTAVGGSGITSTVQVISSDADSTAGTTNALRLYTLNGLSSDGDGSNLLTLAQQGNVPNARNLDLVKVTPVLGGGNDILDGGEANDWLFGRGGNDILTGGSGADTFFYSYMLDGSSGTDTIMDFQVGTDRILIGDLFDLAGTANTLSSASPLIDYNDINITTTTPFSTSSGDTGNADITQTVTFAAMDVNGDGISDVVLTFGNGTVVNVLGVGSAYTSVQDMITKGALVLSADGFNPSV